MVESYMATFAYGYPKVRIDYINGSSSYLSIDNFIKIYNKEVPLYLNWVEVQRWVSKNRRKFISLQLYLNLM